jgi:hypothetical protein
MHAAFWLQMWQAGRQAPFHPLLHPRDTSPTAGARGDCGKAQIALQMRASEARRRPC